MKTYDPFDWYWIVAGDQTRVFSSIAGDYVPVGNATYVAWLADGSVPSRIASEDELGEVLAPYNIRPADAAVLEKYKDAQAKELTIKTVAKALYFIANEIRVLQGKSQLTPAQFRGWLKDLM